MASEPDYGAVFIRLGEIAGGNRDKSAIGDLEPQRGEPRKPRTNAAISSAAVSNAK